MPSRAQNYFMLLILKFLGVRPVPKVEIPKYSSYFKGIDSICSLGWHLRITLFFSTTNKIKNYILMLQNLYSDSIPDLHLFFNSLNYQRIFYRLKYFCLFYCEIVCEIWSGLFLPHLSHTIKKYNCLHINTYICILKYTSVQLHGYS